MIDLLSPRGRIVLAAAVAEGALLGFDFDGTLAPIVEDPAAAAPRPETHALLVRLAARAPLAVISGRRRDDVLARLPGVRADFVGNHGIEPEDGLHGAAVIERIVRGWRVVLAEALPAGLGVAIEDKRLTLALHFRSAPDPARARRIAHDAAQWLPGARLIGGKEVLNVIPFGLADKGTALRALWRRTGRPAALFVGDDDTDEDVFALARDHARLLGVRVGYAATTSARAFIPAQTEVDRLLRALVTLLEG